jgi:hypothetical protein|tara:strand:- start:393 stop:572 length:180 start_codon:yes stop_codon:yes gene_type:complete
MSHKNKILEDLEEYFSEESGKKEYKYQDPKTGEVYTFNRRGVYKKNGRFLIPVSGQSSD